MKKIFLRFCNMLKMIRGYFFQYKVNVMSNEQTLSEIEDKRLSVIRLGDGEFSLIRGENILYQKYNKDLQKNILKILLDGTRDGVLVCISDVFSGLKKYNFECHKFHYESFFYQNRKILKQLSRSGKTYGSAYISRPYIELKDKSNSGDFFEKLKRLWYKKDLLIVEGKYTRSGEGNDLFERANSISRIVIPSKNAYDKIKEIEEQIIKYAGNRLILLMAGPTSKIIIRDLKINRKMENQFIDIGHLDSEYEWFKMGATRKVKIPHKHTAEFNEDNGIVLRNNSTYNSEVVSIIQ